MARVEVFDQRFEVVLVDLDDSHLAFGVLGGIGSVGGVDHDRLAKFAPDRAGRRLAGSVGPRTSRIFRTASAP